MSQKQEKFYKAERRIALKKELASAGFICIGGTLHEKWKHPSSMQLLLPRHRWISPGIAKDIRRSIKQVTSP